MTEICMKIILIPTLVPDAKVSMMNWPVAAMQNFIVQ